MLHFLPLNTPASRDARQAEVQGHGQSLDPLGGHPLPVTLTPITHTPAPLEKVGELSCHLFLQHPKCVARKQSARDTCQRQPLGLFLSMLTWMNSACMHKHSYIVTCVVHVCAQHCMESHTLFHTYTPTDIYICRYLYIIYMICITHTCLCVYLHIT